MKDQPKDSSQAVLTVFRYKDENGINFYDYIFRKKNNVIVSGRCESMSDVFKTLERHSEDLN